MYVSLSIYIYLTRWLGSCNHVEAGALLHKSNAKFAGGKSAKTTRDSRHE